MGKVGRVYPIPCDQKLLEDDAEPRGGIKICDTTGAGDVVTRWGGSSQ